MLNGDRLGIERYLQMQSETALIYIAYGVPVQDAIALAVENALKDQAYLCDLAAKTALLGSPEALGIYIKKASRFVATTMPGTGVGIEIPVPSHLMARVNVSTRMGALPKGATYD